MNKLVILFIAVGLGISGILVVDGITTKTNAPNQTGNLTNQISNLTNQIYNLIEQEIIVNNTGYNQVKNSGWTKYYNTTSELTALGVTSNSTLQTQMDDLQNRVLALQNQVLDLQNQTSTIQSNATNTGNTLIIIGLIGFLIVGLSVLVGYAIHKHMVTLINKSQKTSQ
jgi:hypothetical protein